MKYEHILRAVFSEPWMILPASHASIRELVKAHLLSPEAVQRTGTGVCGEAVELESMRVEGNVAIIPVAGVLGVKLTGMEKSSGATDTQDVIRDIVEAENMAEVDTLLFDIDSPGGMVMGTPELAARIRQSPKHTIAYASGVMASAAYWVAAATNEVWSTRSAIIGSIGIYHAVLDTTEAMRKEGVAVDLIKDAPFKGAGFPGTSLTPEQRNDIQNRVNRIGAEFRAFVLERRPGVDSAFMQGQAFSAADALEHGFIDAVTDDWRATLADRKNNAKSV